MRLAILRSARRNAFIQLPSHMPRHLDILDKLCDEGKLEEALDIIEQQYIEVSRNNAYCILKECCKRQDVQCGRRIQGLVSYSGLDSVGVLGCQLIRLFSSRGFLVESSQAFNKVIEPTVYAWSAIISANADLGDAATALHLYAATQFSHVSNDIYVYVATLKACTLVSNLQEGKLIHEDIIQSGNGFQYDVFVASTLVDMYAKCGDLEEACNAFVNLPNPNVVSWTAMIDGYAQHGEGVLALECFDSMQNAGQTPNAITCSSILKACGDIGAIERCRQIHERAIDVGLLDVFVGSSLVLIYSNCGSLDEAQRVFDRLPYKDVVLWGTLISAYVFHDENILALEFFDKMQQNELKPDSLIYSSILKACGSLGAIEKGREIHKHIVRFGLQADSSIGSTLVDMYAKCGSLGEAWEVFDKLGSKDIVSWGAIIAGYADYGESSVALEYFDKMVEQGINPNAIIFTAVLNACSRAGLVDRGRRYFKSMQECHGIMPDVIHYNCMVDLLARAGCLQEAEDFLRSITCSNIVSWKTLLSACQTHGNVEIGKRCFDEIVLLDSTCVPAYILMSNTYAATQMRKA